MTVDISEQAFEDHIEATLLADDRNRVSVKTSVSKALREPSPAYDPGLAPGGYLRRTTNEYDRALCLLPQDVYDFILATQPKAWARPQQHHGAETRERFLRKLAREITRRGALDVLRSGIKERGVKFDLAYFRPSSGLNEKLARLYRGNLFAVVRQLRYSETSEKSLDMALFLNGIPLFTAELKNPLSGQTVLEAIKQYRRDRDPREPLLAYGRCLAHFAVDPELVYVTTHLQGNKTRFLPFNQGRYGGAGNPPVPPTSDGYPTGYLWSQIWAGDSVLDLVRQFIHEVEEEDEEGVKTGRRFLIFPRFQQLDAVRRLVAGARAAGTGQRYLIQHSAGSGKSYTIAWLAHQLSTLHDSADKRVFDSIIVITDRRVLDRQLQRTVRQFEQTLGVVENIDTTSRQLKQALEEGKTIIVTTLQKFPVIAAQISALPGQRFAVIVDEAHSSQTGESSKSMKAVLAAGSLEEAEAEEAGAQTREEELEDAVLAEIEKRGRQPNLSLFAFTATPKPKTLELFGVPRPDGKFAPFHLYSMRQAIEEGFILDVLANYSTYKAYWRLLKKIEEDPRYDKGKAFERGEYRILIAANKFQTGFDQPLLHTMYVDKKLGGVGAVQTLSRLNRTHPEKEGTAVLDFANEAEAIKKAFDPYYETTLLSEATDPDLLYDLVYRLRDFGVYDQDDIERFAEVYFLGPRGDQPRLYAVLDPVVARVGALPVDEQRDLRGTLTDYIRLYAFLSQVLPFQDPDLEKLYAFARYLRTKVAPEKEELPREVQENIDLDSYDVRETSKGAIKPDRGQGAVDPPGVKGPYTPPVETLEPLSQIIAELNERFGDQAANQPAVAQVMEELDADPGLAASARVNTRDNLFLTFRQKTIDKFQDLVDSNFALYKRVTDDEAYGDFLINLLFDQYMRRHRQAAELIRQNESLTLEFKSSLRWDLKEDVKNDRAITHAALKTIAAFLNTQGGDLLLGVADDGSVVGIEVDRLDDDDKFMLHLMQVARNGLGDRAGTLLDPRTEVIAGKTVCLVSCRRSPEPVYLKWKGLEKSPEGDFYVRSGPGSIRLAPEDVAAYTETRFT